MELLLAILLVALILFIIKITKACAKETFDLKEGNPLGLVDCPAGMVPTLGGLCLMPELSKTPAKVGFTPGSTKETLMPYRHWRMYPGRHLHTWHPSWGPRPHYWGLIRSSHPAYKCLDSCYGVPHRFACLQACRARYGF